MSATIVAAATTACYLALAAAGSSPPAWMWGALVAVNGSALALAYRRRRAA